MALPLELHPQKPGDAWRLAAGRAEQAADHGGFHRIAARPACRGLPRDLPARACSLRDLIKCNFELDIEDPALKGKWERIVNWYLGHTLRCKRLTKGGNYIFSGGEELWIPTIEAIEIDLSTEPRVIVRRTERKIQKDMTLDDYPVPADPGDRGYKGAQPILDAILGRTPRGSQALAGRSDESVVFENQGEVKQEYILIGCRVLQDVIELPASVNLPGGSIGDKIIRAPGGSISLPGGQLIRTTRLFSYGPGAANQQVVVTITKTYKDQEGRTTKVEDFRNLEPQPANYTF
jgi:hypothetical protein